ncbi:MAG: citrate transporter [Lachnospiraceae bacterium]|nr:citrate transporter [Lachnospiraceae bacterium]
MKKTIKSFIKNQTVLFIAIIAMLITCIIIPPDDSYLEYFNFTTLATLFCTLSVVNAFADIHIFEIISKSIIVRLRNLRRATFGIVFITFFGSMILANDMALLTFLPLGYYLLKNTDNKQYMAYVFILQNIAANLGGMLTPFGNPQNLYLYSYYNIDTVKFMAIMFRPFIVSTIVIIILCLFVKPVPLVLKNNNKYFLNLPKTVIYSFLFIFSILIVLRIFPYVLGTGIITLLLIVMDRHAIKTVNYPLILTFCAFFVFSGNMARIPEVHMLFNKILPIDTLFFGILSCQFISNVPSAVLLSHFTNDYASLLPAVNIGGLGTLIASLASLITFSEYRKHKPDDIRSYITKFSIINFAFVMLLLITCKIH